MGNPENIPVESIIKKLRQEQFDTMERSFKSEEKKILFILALFGVGGYNTGMMKEFGYLYYFIPLLAIAFDVLITRQAFSVRRIGVFLREHSTDLLEKEWETFVDKHRDKCYRFGIDAFTIISFGASVWLVFKYIHEEKFCGIKTFEYQEYIWFVLLACVGIYTRYSSLKRIKKLDRVTVQIPITSYC